MFPYYLGPRGPLVLPLVDPFDVRPFVPPLVPLLVCLFALKIWITYLQAYLPYLMNHQKTHQTNPMAPWDLQEAPWTPKQPS